MCGSVAARITTQKFIPRTRVKTKFLSQESEWRANFHRLAALPVGNSGLDDDAVGGIVCTASDHFASKPHVGPRLLACYAMR
jgi:hypothetical protein